MSLRTLLNSDYSWLPELTARQPVEPSKFDSQINRQVKKASLPGFGVKRDKSKFEGIDVYVVSQMDEAILFALIDGAVDWSPFELVDLIKTGHGGNQANAHVADNEWLCRFKFKAQYKDARPMISSLLDSIEHVVPWTLAEKVFEKRKEPNEMNKKNRMAA